MRTGFPGLPGTGVRFPAERAFGMRISVRLGKRATMEKESTIYPYRRYTITIFRDEGVWWAKARVSEKDAGGDRPVLGGP